MNLFFTQLHASGDDMLPGGQPSAQVDEFGIPENPFAQPAQARQPRRRAARTTVQPPESAPAAPPQPQPVMPVPGQQSAPRRMRTQDGSQFQPPVSPALPDWLRTAQQNNLPSYDRPQGPRVQSAPQQQERPMRRPAPSAGQTGYAQNGYPPAYRRPAAQQPAAQNGYQPVSYRRPAPQTPYAPAERDDAPPSYRRAAPEQAAQPVSYRRPALQTSYAPAAQDDAPPSYRRAAPEQAAQPVSYRRPAPQTPYAPAEQDDAPPSYRRAAPVQEAPDREWQVETDEEDAPRELPAWVRKAPWLGIAAFICLLSAVIIWIAGMHYEKQLAQVFEDRAAQEQAIVEKYPLRYQETIGQKADRYNLSPAFVAAIVMNESSFRPEVSASSGVDGDYARGLMQLRPSTAEWIHGKIGLVSAFHADDLFTPEANLEYGCWYLNYLSDLFYGDPVLVAAAYHAGQGEVRNWLNTAAYSPSGRSIAIERIPFSDTRRYVTRVMDAYAAYLRIYYGG